MTFFLVQKVLKSCKPPPLVSFLRDMLELACMHENQPEILGFFKMFFLYYHIVSEYSLDIGKYFEAIFLPVNRILLAFNQALKFAVFHFLHGQP